ncbi:MAG TPA: class I SAM-dependent methyltransferase [Thermoanaerobaculia bacterium]
MTKHDVTERLAALYARRPLQGYVRWKVRTDPAYRAALDVLRGRNTPLLDLGCGVGLLPFFLREHGYSAPVTGIDFDQRKIDLARVAAAGYRDVEFIAGDARAPLPPNRDVVLLDILHYFDSDSRQQILNNVVRAVAPEGVVVIRQVIHDGSWRARFTRFVDRAAHIFRWMKAERVELPTREELVRAFDGFDADIRPLWGRMPYNNYLFVFRKR